MIRKSAFFLALAALIVAAAPASAVIGTIDQVPASTLLLPYFEVSDDGNQTTLFEINNASAAPAIAHVTLWTNWSIPTLDFNVFLTGYDIVTFNLRDLFLNGTVPTTDPDPPYPPGIPAGLFSLPNTTTPPISTAGCSDQLPLPALPAGFRAHLNAIHQGEPSPSNGECYAWPTEDRVGYITVDNVFTCTLLFPGDAGYFGVGGQYRVGANTLWGNYYLVDVANNFAQGDTLVHIESDPLFPGSAPPLGTYTFYSRYTAPPLGTYDDGAEGLTSLFAARYIGGAAFSGGTEYLVWRDGKFPTADDDTITCGFAPGWWPLAQTQIVVFDEDENPEVPSQNFSGEPEQGFNPFPNETQRVQVGGPDFPVNPASGWNYLNLNWPTGFGPTAPTLDPEMQNWVVVLMNAEGRYSVGFNAIQLDNVSGAGNNQQTILSEP